MCWRGGSAPCRRHLPVGDRDRDGGRVWEDPFHVRECGVLTEHLGAPWFVRVSLRARCTRTSPTCFHAWPDSPNPCAKITVAVCVDAGRMVTASRSGGADICVTERRGTLGNAANRVWEAEGRSSAAALPNGLVTSLHLASPHPCCELSVPAGLKISGRRERTSRTSRCRRNRCMSLGADTAGGR
jgi:hypothetical protein